MQDYNKREVGFIFHARKRGLQIMRNLSGKILNGLE